TGTSALPGGCVAREVVVRAGGPEWVGLPPRIPDRDGLATNSSHLQAQRPQAYCYTPPTSDLRPRTGALGPRAAARPCVLLTSDLRTWASSPRAAAREVVPRKACRVIIFFLGLRCWVSKDLIGWVLGTEVGL